MKTPAYRYKARAHRIIDGDTYELSIDFGFQVYGVITVRLRGVDTPEMKTKKGPPAKEFVHTCLFHEGTGSPESGTGDPLPLIVETYKDRQTFARWVADVWLSDGRRLADVIIEAGHGKVLDIP